MPDPPLMRAIAAVPAGRWCVGVSGGADSVALLRLLCERPELSLHVAHLDHQTRGQQSTDDAAFVSDLARALGLPCSIATREELEESIGELPANRSARFRVLRLALFARVIAEHDLGGVVLAHHADDQAHTIFHRLVRGSGPAGLRGMAATVRVRGVRICRPLLTVRRAALRDYLHGIGQSWRDDASNESGEYLRNRARKIVEPSPPLHDALCALGRACGELEGWLAASTPPTGETLPGALLTELPHLLAAQAARRWLARSGVPAGDITPAAVERLLQMATDAAAPPRQHFAGGVLIRRQRGTLTAVPPKR